MKNKSYVKFAKSGILNLKNYGSFFVRSKISSPIYLNVSIFLATKKPHNDDSLCGIHFLG